MFSSYDDERKAEREKKARTKQAQFVFFTNLDPIWYFGAAIAALAFSLRLFSIADGDGPTNIIGLGILLLSLSCMFVGGFLYFNRGINESDETGFSSIKHKIIPIGILAVASLAFLSGEANTASNLGDGVGLFSHKNEQDLKFKSLVAGSNVTLTEGPETVTIALSSSASSGTLSTLQEGGVQVGDADIVTANFDSGFDLVESPNTLVTVSFDPTELTLTDDSIYLGNSSNLVAATALVDCVDSGGNHLNYTAATNTFSCGTSSSGSGSGTLNSIKESGVQIGGSDIAALDFGVGFDCSETPDTEINCVLDYTEDPVDLTSEITGTLPVANGGTGQTAATLNALLLGDGSSFDLKTLPDCDNATTSKLLFDTTTSAFSCGTDQSGAGGADPVDIEDDNVSEQTDASIIDFGTNLDVSCTSGDCVITIADVFALAAGDIYTGVHDFGGATSLEIPNGAGGTTVNTAGEITVDTTSDTLNFHNGTSEQVLNPVKSFSFSVENPTAAEDLSVWFSDFAITIIKETCVVVGSTPSVTVTLRHGTDRSATGAELNTGGNIITSTTTGDVDTTFNDATIVADSHVWLETTAQSGTVDMLTCTWNFTQDA